jgi:hypothetical protein
VFDNQSTKKFATISSRWLRTSTLYRPSSIVERDGYGGIALKTNGIVIPLETKLLIVGDSVDGLFIKRRGMVMRLPTRFHILVTALCVRVISPSRNATATH